MIALDTGFLIYGTQTRRTGRRGFSEIQAARVPEAVAVLDELEVSGKAVMVPAPAAWEYVLDFPIADQALIWAAFTGFAIAPFDAAAARLAAKISRRHSDRVSDSAKGLGKQRAQEVGARQQMKVDIQILSIAIAQRAEAIYTLEVEKFSEWAAGAIAVIGLPKTKCA